MKLTSYFKEHQLSIKALKTESIIFSKIVRKRKLKMDGTLVEKQDLKYIGVHIDNRLTFQSEVIFFCIKWFLQSKPNTQFASLCQDHH